MSRVGRLPITIPKGVEVKFANHNVSVKGPKGALSRFIDPCIMVNIKDGEITLTRSSEQKRDRAMHGLYRALLGNMIEGVDKGFKTEQEIVGVGFRANVTGQLLELTLGFSHTVIFELPKDIKATAIAEKGKPPALIMESFDKELLGLVAAKVRSLRKPDVYKGKGVRYKGEQLRIKPGKTAAGSGASGGK
jgi:large subunit ribosomal protein L6